MTIYSDRFIPVRTGNENNPINISPEPAWIPPSRAAYNKRVSYALFDYDITKKKVLTLQKIPSSIPTSYFAPEPYTIPSLKWLSKKPTPFKKYDSTGEDENQSFRIGTDFNGNLYLLTLKAAYTRSIDTNSDVTTIPGSFTALAPIPKQCFSALATDEGHVVLNENETFTNIRTVYRGNEKITCMKALSKNSLFVGTEKGLLILVDIRQPTPAYTLDIGIMPITGMAVNNSKVALGSDSGKVVLQDLDKIGHNQSIVNSTITHGRTLSFSTSNQNFLAAAEDKTIKIWNVADNSIPIETVELERDISTLSWYSERTGFKVTHPFMMEAQPKTAVELLTSIAPAHVPTFVPMTELAYVTRKPDDMSWIKTDSLNFSEHIYFHTNYRDKYDIYLTRENLYAMVDTLITSRKPAPLTSSQLNTMLTWR